MAISTLLARTDEVAIGLIGALAGEQGTESVDLLVSEQIAPVRRVLLAL